VYSTLPAGADSGVASMPTAGRPSPEAVAGAAAPTTAAAEIEANRRPAALM
jgi:hypothetical protein